MKRILFTAAAVALAACSSDQLTGVKFAIENHPPAGGTIQFEGNGIMVPAGIGIAFVVTLSVNSKTTSDQAGIASGDTNCVVSSGVNNNEFFMVCNSAGTSSIIVSDDESDGNQLGTLTIPVTVTGQTGSMMLPDGGLTPPPFTDSGPVESGPVDAGEDSPVATPDAGEDGAAD